MPKKTKKQKILARLHRLEQQTEEPKGFSIAEIEHPTQNTKPKPTKTVVSDRRGEENSYSHIYKDIRKVFILTVVALLIEISLSLTASTSYAKLVLRALNLE